MLWFYYFQLNRAWSALLNHAMSHQGLNNVDLNIKMTLNLLIVDFLFVCALPLLSL